LAHTDQVQAVTW